MAKISTYANAGSPQLADKLIGTKVGGSPVDGTYNFTLQSLLSLFAQNITLQNVLDAGNTATEDINLTGNIYVTLVKPDDIEDETSSTGTAGQFLSKTATGILWDNAPIPPTPTLDEVLTAGNVSIQDASIGTIFLYNPHLASGNGYVSITGDKNRFNFDDNANVNIAIISQDTLALVDSVVPGRQFQIKKPASIGAPRTATFQDADGTVAYLSNIPVVVTPDLKAVLTAGNTATEDINLTGKITTTDFESENDITVSSSVNKITVGRGSGNNGRNTVVGNGSLRSNVSGENLTAVGYLSLNNNVSGIVNTAIGGNSLELNVSGSYNTAVGSHSLQKNTTGSKNSALGENSLANNTTGEGNVAIGQNSLANNTTGEGNVAVGGRAGINLTTGGFNVYIGSSVNASSDAAVNEIVIGRTATGVGDNTVVIGNNSIIKTILRGVLNIAGTPSGSAGLSIGDVYYDGSGNLKIVN